MSRVGFTIDETTKIKNDPKSRMTKRDAVKAEYWENEKTKQEILDAAQDNKKEAIKKIAEQEKERIGLEQKKKDDVMNHLDMVKRQVNSYKATLAQSLAQFLELLDWIPGWKAQVIVTDGSPISIKGKGFRTEDGLLLVIITADGRIFHQGMLVTQDPGMDYICLNKMALSTENTLDKEKGLLLDNLANDKPSEGTIVDKYGNPIQRAN
jgi:hypothetical protein